MSRRSPFEQFAKHYMDLREDGYETEEAVDIAAVLVRIGEQLLFQTDAERGIAEIPITHEREAA